MIFKHKFEAGIEDVNSHFEITNKAILKYLENTVIIYSNLLKSEMPASLQDNFTWVLVEWKLEVLKRPKYGAKVEVHAWTKDVDSKCMYCDFEVYDGERKCAVATSKWALIDLNTKRIIPVSKEHLAKYQPEPSEAISAKSLDRIDVPEDFSECVDVNIRKSDIDINGHVHNLNYLDLIAELMDFNEESSEIRIIYKKEIKYGDKVMVCKKKVNDGTFFVIKNNEEIKTIIKI